MTDTVENLILDLMEWLARKKRTYEETMDAWRTSCPRLSIWEDAIERGLVEITFADGQSTVTATPAGLSLLKAKRPRCNQQLSGRNMSSNDYDAFTQNWIAAWNSHDLERILTHYSDDVELVSPFVAKLIGAGESAVRGKPALREYFSRGLKAFPALRFDLIRLNEGVRSCVVEYSSVDGLRSAELMEFDDEGKVRRVLAHYTAAEESRC